MSHLIAFVVASLSPLEVPCTDTVWYYTFANPAEDRYIRCWGSEGETVGKPVEGVTGFSYSAIRFVLPPEAPRELTAAKLVLTHVPDPRWSLEDARANPVDIRPVSPEFSMKDWQLADGQKIYPPSDPESSFARAVPEPVVAGRPIRVEFDLLSGPGDFRGHYRKALERADRALALAITSDLLPVDQGAIYKFFSANAEPEYRPVLILEGPSETR